MWSAVVAAARAGVPAQVQRDEGAGAGGAQAAAVAPGRALPRAGPHRVGHSGARADHQRLRAARAQTQVTTAAASCSEWVECLVLSRAALYYLEGIV